MANNWPTARVSSTIKTSLGKAQGKRKRQRRDLRLPCHRFRHLPLSPKSPQPARKEGRLRLRVPVNWCVNAGWGVSLFVDAKRLQLFPDDFEDDGVVEETAQSFAAGPTS